MADDESNRRCFAIDNGISFGGWIWNFFSSNWNIIRVPAIRRTVVDRLRRVERSQIEALGWLAELRADAGSMRLVEATSPIDPARGAADAHRRRRYAEGAQKPGVRLRITCGGSSTR